MPNAVEFSKVTKRYGAAVVLKGLSTEMPEGQVIGLLGHNGAGKTTLIKLVLGLIAPSEGTVRALGHSPAGPEGRQLHARIGYLPENVTFYDNLTGREVLDYFARLKRVAANEADVLLDRVGLAAAASCRVRTYSKGMRQRLGLAQALLGSPDLLLLDEPTTGLDPMATQLFFQQVGELRSQGKTVVISSHLLAELEPHLDRALILKEGRLVTQGTVSQMHRDAGLPDTITARFSGRINGLLKEGWVAELPVAPRQREPSLVEFAVPAARKMDVMRRLMQFEALSDITVKEPSLTHLYATLGADKQAKGDDDGE